MRHASLLTSHMNLVSTETGRHSMVYKQTAREFGRGICFCIPSFEKRSFNSIKCAWRCVLDPPCVLRISGDPTSCKLKREIRDTLCRYFHRCSSVSPTFSHSRLTSAWVSKEGFIFSYISIQSSGTSITSYETTNRRLEKIQKQRLSN
jgi:hypothetical protein